MKMVAGADLRLSEARDYFGTVYSDVTMPPWLSAHQPAHSPSRLRTGFSCYTDASCQVSIHGIPIRMRDGDGGRYGARTHGPVVTARCVRYHRLLPVQLTVKPLRQPAAIASNFIPSPLSAQP